MPAAATDTQQTRERLLDAAGEIFAAQGFGSATIRDICDRADANVAAVKYHFGDKCGLYSAVLQRCAASAKILQALPEDPLAQVRAIVRGILESIFDNDRPAWYTRLIMREMFEPTEALAALVNACMRPIHQALTRAVDQLTDGKLDRASRGRCVRSLIAQCVYYHHSKAVVARLEPELRFTPAEIKRHTEHIVEFTLGGLERLADQAARG